MKKLKKLLKEINKGCNKYHISSTDIKNCISSKEALKDSRSFRDNENIYHVYPIAVTESVVYIICPLCGAIHIHGVSYDGTYGGHRVCHCDNNSDYIHSGYIIEEI